MTEGKEYVFYREGLLMSSKQPMKNVDVSVVSTPNYIFFVPIKSVGLFLIVNTITTHQYFQDVSVPDGVQRLVEEATSQEDLEKSFIALLEDDEKYVHKIADKKKFKFNGFLGKHTLRMSTGGGNWTSIMPKGKGTSKEFRAYHEQLS